MVMMHHYLDPDTGRRRHLGVNQLAVLQLLARPGTSGTWHYGCGWTWDYPHETARQLRSLARYGLVDVVEPPGPARRQLGRYQITDNGRTVALAFRTGRALNPDWYRKHRAAARTQAFAALRTAVDAYALDEGVIPAGTEPGDLGHLFDAIADDDRDAIAAALAQLRPADLDDPGPLGYVIACARRYLTAPSPDPVGACPPAAGHSAGHQLVWDPPAGLSSASRWTCRRPGCRRSLISAHGNVYGSARDEPCPSTPKAAR